MLRKTKNTTGNKMTSRTGWPRRLTDALISFYESRRGPIYAQRRHSLAIMGGRSITRGLTEIRSRWPDVRSTAIESPVFILSAGWRSGSTLMQRLVNSEQSILVWGEPYSHARILHHLAAAISAITPAWPEEDWFVDRYELNRLTDTFTANMYPDMQDLLEACIAYMRALFQEPARKRGFCRWGVKDVRLTIDDAHFLRWLYPQAKIILLCRNPYDAYRSYRVDRSWYNEWPDDPVFTADRFGRHWRLLAEGFRDGWSDIDGIFVRYEDLCADAATLGRLEEYLDMKLDRNLLGRTVGTHKKAGSVIPRSEFRQLRKKVSGFAESLGYNPDS